MLLQSNLIKLLWFFYSNLMFYSSGLPVHRISSGIMDTFWRQEAKYLPFFVQRTIFCILIFLHQI